MKYRLSQTEETQNRQLLQNHFVHGRWISILRLARLDMATQNDFTSAESDPIATVSLLLAFLLEHLDQGLQAPCVTKPLTSTKNKWMSSLSFLPCHGGLQSAVVSVRRRVSRSNGNKLSQRDTAPDLDRKMRGGSWHLCTLCVSVQTSGDIVDMDYKEQREKDEVMKNACRRAEIQDPWQRASLELNRTKKFILKETQSEFDYFRACVLPFSCQLLYVFHLQNCP